MHRNGLSLILAAAFTTALLAQAPPGPAGPAGNAPAGAGSVRAAAVDAARLRLADAAIEKAIADKQIPGAVLLVGRADQVLYQKAYGMRALVPQAEPMTLDTVFDMASVTKVVATTTAVMMLVEDGKIRLNDRVATFIPDFGRYGKGDITIRHLLTHVSGLRPDLDLGDDSWRGHALLHKAVEGHPRHARDDVGEEEEVDVAVNEAFPGRRGGHLLARAPDGFLVAPP